MVLRGGQRGKVNGTNVARLHYAFDGRSSKTQSRIKKISPRRSFSGFLPLRWHQTRNLQQDIYGTRTMPGIFSYIFNTLTKLKIHVMP